jgi:hypothetical protein
MAIKIDLDSTILTTASPYFILTIPADLNGLNILSAAISVTTPSTSGDPTVQLTNITNGTTITSTSAVIQANEYNSKDGTAAVINASYDNVATGDRIGVNVLTAGTGAKGLQLDLKFG